MFDACLAKYKCKKIIENYSSVGAGAHKVGKVFILSPWFSWYLEKCEIGKLRILKKFGLSTFKEILQKCVYNSNWMFSNVFLFFMKGYSGTLTYLHAFFISNTLFQLILSAA